ncbi:hypothetical protein KFU94_09120 [Chloroflexi bacterium TSY]|nr:hypothetical protein [Chloroflexi bacterium TSY]
MATTDVTTTHFEIECKHRKKLPDWLQGAVKQAENGDSSKIPLVVLHQANMHSARDLCVLRMCDFDQLRQAFEDIEFLKTCAPDVYQRFFEEAE